MAPIDHRVRLWAWLVQRQGSIGTKSEAEVIAMQSRHTPGNAVINRILGTVVPGAEVSDRAIAGPAGDIPVRVYRPARGGTGPRPLILNFHGGGFVFGDLRLADWMCSSAAVTVGAVVVSVDYRLAPLHRFPAAVDDCYAALVWAAENAAGLGAAGPGNAPPLPIGVMGENRQPRSPGPPPGHRARPVSSTRGSPPSPGPAFPGRRSGPRPPRRSCTRAGWPRPRKPAGRPGRRR